MKKGRSWWSFLRDVVIYPDGDSGQYECVEPGSFY